MSSVVIHQPEYFPWINLFFKMMKSDKFIFWTMYNILEEAFRIEIF